jgi:hypothetical protein
MQLLETLAHLFHPRRSNNHRPRVLHPEAFVYFSIIALVFALAIFASPRIFTSLENVLGYASNITIDQVVALTNAERSSQGLSPLIFNPTLSKAAASKGSDMFANQYWAHTSPSGKEPWAFISEAGYSYRVAGENLARDFAVSEQVVKAWMASPTHRANIVNAAYEEIGVAVVNGELNGMETTLVVQMFGTPRVRVAEALPPATTTSAGTSVESGVLSASDNSTRPTTLPRVAQPITQPTAQPVANQPADAQNATPTSATADSTAQLDVERADQEVSILPPTTTDTVILGGVVVPQAVLESPLISPSQLLKAFFLSMLLLIAGVLCYDLAIIESRKTVRFVGKNIAHLMLFTVVIFLIIFFKGGVVG